MRQRYSATDTSCLSSYKIERSRRLVQVSRSGGMQPPQRPKALRVQGESVVRGQALSFLYTTPNPKFAIL